MHFSQGPILHSRRELASSHVHGLNQTMPCIVLNKFLFKHSMLKRGQHAPPERSSRSVLRNLTDFPGARMLAHDFDGKPSPCTTTAIAPQNEKLVHQPVNGRTGRHVTSSFDECEPRPLAVRLQQIASTTVPPTPPIEQKIIRREPSVGINIDLSPCAEFVYIQFEELTQQQSMHLTSPNELELHLRIVADPQGPSTQYTTDVSLSFNRNPGTPLDLDWVERVHVNRSAVERRTTSLPGRRTVKQAWQAAWLMRAITLIDLTTLQGDDTPGNVRRLCAKARSPLRSDIIEALGAQELPIRVGAVCVFHEMVSSAAAALHGSNIPVAAVSTGFPTGMTPFPLRVQEIEYSVEAGAAEIDIVISRRHVLTGDWRALYDEVRAYRQACGDAHLKTILETGELPTLRTVQQASLVCMMAGADFIKTSTGKVTVNATLPVGLTMVRAIREYAERTGCPVGFKPAGGIRTAKQALDWMILIKEELGDDWLQPHLFRFGASSLLADIERQLEHAVTGRYSASFRHPMM